VFESCSNPQKTRQVFEYAVKNYFFVSDVRSGVLLTLLSHFISPWAQTARWWYVSQVFIENRLKSESFETLDGLLVFRVQKLCPKNN